MDTVLYVLGQCIALTCRKILDVQLTNRGKVGIVAATFACLAVAWVCRPNSIKRLLADSGFVLERVSIDEPIRLFAFPSRRAGFYDMPERSESKLRTALTKAGYRNPFGRGKMTSTIAGRKISAMQEVWIRGYRLPPICDYDRVKIIEYGSTKTICFDPDLR